MGADFSRVGLRLEAVAVAAYRFHEGRIVAGGVNLVTQTLDVGVHRLGLGEVLPAPGVAEQILAGLEENPVENPRGIVPPEPAQISFLAPQEPQKDTSRTALKMLASASPDDMTPREAHDFVYELVRLVQEEE